MTLAPENAMSPMAQAPPDRPTADLEQVTNQWLALILRDGGIDQNEMRIILGAMQQITLKIQQQGGLAQGAAQGGDPSQPPPSPMEMNSTGMEDYGSGQGDPVDEGSY